MRKRQPLFVYRPQDSFYNTAMVFHPAEPNENFMRRWVSSEGNWEIGHTQMMFGVRVRFGRVGNGWCELDYCAGADSAFQDELLRTIMIILIPISEDVLPSHLRDMFPKYDVKPINLDPCWEKLKQMAERVLQQQSVA